MVRDSRLFYSCFKATGFGDDKLPDLADEELALKIYRSSLDIVVNAAIAPDFVLLTQKAQMELMHCAHVLIGNIQQHEDDLTSVLHAVEVLLRVVERFGGC